MITDIKQLDLNKSYTYADYLTWQFDEMVELIKGKIVRMSPAPKRIHQEIIGQLYYTLRNQLHNDGCNVYLAPFDVRLSKTKDNKSIITVVQPDISIVCDLSKLDDNGCVGAPDLIIEILSKKTYKIDYNEKFQLYEENKVKEYWLADPAQKFVDCYALKRGKYIRTALVEEKGQVIQASFNTNIKFKWEEVFA